MGSMLSRLFLAALTGTALLGGYGVPDDATKKTNRRATDSMYFRAVLNGEAWRAEPRALIHGKNNLLIEGKVSDPQSLWHATLIFTVPFTGSGTYSLIWKNRSGRVYGGSYQEANGDVGIATYYPTDDSSANQLTITSYDSTTGIMTGRFHTTVVVDEGDQYNPRRRRSDRLRFTDGSFKVKVEDRRDQ